MKQTQYLRIKTASGGWRQISGGSHLAALACGTDPMTSPQHDDAVTEMGMYDEGGEGHGEFFTFNPPAPGIEAVLQVRWKARIRLHGGGSRPSIGKVDCYVANAHGVGLYTSDTGSTGAWHNVGNVLNRPGGGGWTPADIYAPFTMEMASPGGPENSIDPHLGYGTIATSVWIEVDYEVPDPPPPAPPAIGVSGGGAFSVNIVDGVHYLITTGIKTGPTTATPKVYRQDGGVWSLQGDLAAGLCSPALGESYPHFSLAGVVVSPDQKMWITRADGSVWRSIGDLTAVFELMVPPPESMAEKSAYLTMSN